jgi:hypothetical protein
MNRPGLLLGIVLLFGTDGGLRHELAVCLPEQICRALQHETQVSKDPMQTLHLFTHSSLSFNEFTPTNGHVDLKALF